MNNFLLNSSLALKIVYISALILISMYFIIKYRERRYIFSIFNISTLILSAFTYFFIGVFQYNDIAWNALNQFSAQSFIPYLNKTMMINSIGFILFIIFTISLEFKTYKYNKLNYYIDNISINIAPIPTMMINIVVLMIWYYLVLSSIGTMPIFGNRMFASKLGFQTLYNILNGAINIFSIYYSIKFISEKKILYMIFMICNIVTLFFIGNRNIFLFTILNMYIFYLYKSNRNSIKITKNILLSIILVMVLGILLDFLRRLNMDINSSSILNDILYGNTFCDIRDGAFILYGMDNAGYKMLYGKTFLADILGFLPTEIMPYRDIWSYGNFTTKTLFGSEHQPGLRGGWFLTSYINFGYVGVIISALIFAYFYSNLERYFYYTFIKDKNFKHASSKVIICDIVQKLSLGILITSGISQTYARIGIILIIIAISIFLRRKILLYRIGKIKINIY